MVYQPFWGQRVASRHRWETWVTKLVLCPSCNGDVYLEVCSKIQSCSHHWLPVSKRLSRSQWGSSYEFMVQLWRKTQWAIQSHGCSQWHGVLPSPLRPASNDFCSLLPDGRSWGRKPPFQTASSPPAQALLPPLNSVNQNIYCTFGP